MMNINQACFSIVFLFFALIGQSRAEGGCPDGQFPQQNGTAMMCVPGNVSGGAGGARQPVWINRWGAISVDAKAGSVGIASDMLTKRKAIKAAQADCQSKGGSSCGADISYYNQCAAMVTGSQTYNTASAATQKEAIDLGMQTCNDGVNSNCRVFYVGCSFPVRAD